MYLLVGLGNPGSKYKKNRHNVGHMTIDMIVKKDSISTTLPALTPRQQGQLGGKGYRGGYGF